MKSPSIAPAYMGIYPVLAEVAQEQGYALTIHGSCSRDFDLVAVPWVDEPSPARELVLALAEVVGYCSGTIVMPETLVERCEAKPHGRLAWSIPLEAGAVIDLSVMPTQSPESEAPND